MTKYLWDCLLWDTWNGTRDTGHGTRDMGHGTRHGTWDTGHGTWARDTGHGTWDTTWDMGCGTSVDFTNAKLFLSWLPLGEMEAELSDGTNTHHGGG